MAQVPSAELNVSNCQSGVWKQSSAGVGDTRQFCIGGGVVNLGVHKYCGISTIKQGYNNEKVACTLTGESGSNWSLSAPKYSTCCVNCF